MPLSVPARERTAGARRRHATTPHARPVLMVVVALLALLRMVVRWVLRRRVRKARVEGLRLACAALG
jgi:hypothetical protein